MDFLFMALIALFGIGAGILIGAGNPKGLIGAILPGIIGGLVLSIPSMRDGDWTSTGIMIGAVLVGTIIAVLIPEKGRLKTFCREQSSLRISVGYYKLGKQPKDKTKK